jgi:hypothetical protein
MPDRNLDRAADVAFEAANATDTHADTEPAELRRRTTEYCVEPGFSDPRQHLN